MQYLINGTKFIIEETHKGFVWDNGYTDGEYCATELESLQEAMNYVSRTAREEYEAELSRIEDECFGSYEKQVRTHHEYLIRH